VTAPNKPKAAGRADRRRHRHRGKPKKFGREIDDGSVTAPNKPKAAGRAIDDGSVKADKPKKYGRAIDDGTVKAPNKQKHGRAIDDNKVKAAGPSGQARPRSRRREEVTTRSDCIGSAVERAGISRPFYLSSSRSRRASLTACVRLLALKRLNNP
jgi:hypothetical protein